MSKRRMYHYSRSPGERLGRMICSACGKKITDGEFRYRETEEKYIVQHRTCTESDPKWAELDASREQAVSRWSEVRAAADEFFAKWGVDGFDALEEIAQRDGGQ